MTKCINFVSRQLNNLSMVEDWIQVVEMESMKCLYTADDQPGVQVNKAALGCKFQKVLHLTTFLHLTATLKRAPNKAV